MAGLGICIVSSQLTGHTSTIQLSITSLSPDKMSTYKLTYFDAKARAEVPRLLFAKAGVKYEDERINHDQFKELKDKTPFGQVPILEVDGKVICQGYAITRFLAKRFGLAGKDEFEEARMDEVALGMEDIIQPLFKFFNEKDETRKAEAKKKYEEEQLPGYLKFLERMLVQNKGGDGFFIGDSVTAADLCYTHFIGFTRLGHITIDWSNYPKLQALSKRVEEDDPKIAEWIKNRPVTAY